MSQYRNGGRVMEEIPSNMFQFPSKSGA